jgi:hypothetical protein
VSVEATTYQNGVRCTLTEFAEFTDKATSVKTCDCEAAYVKHCRLCRKSPLLVCTCDRNCHTNMSPLHFHPHSSLLQLSALTCHPYMSVPVIEIVGSQPYMSVPVILPKIVCIGLARTIYLYTVCIQYFWQENN